MKLAIAQINARLGDIDHIAQRILSQAHLAHEQGAQLLCSPAPLFTGVLPGQLLSDAQFQSDLLHALELISVELSALDMVGLIPAALEYSSSSLFEVFMLKEGRVVPLRLLSAKDREGGPHDIWAPPVLEVFGSRVAVTFDAARDLPQLSTGLDLVIHFPVDAYSYSEDRSWDSAGLSGSQLPELVRSAGVWFANVCPVGSYDSALYIGGSSLLDDNGVMVGDAPLFEDSLLCADVARGLAPLSNPSDMAAGSRRAYSRWEMLWGALKLYVQDELSSRAMDTAAVLLDGSFESKLLAALVVDSLGPRKVVAMLPHYDGAVTPQEQADEQRRVDSCRVFVQTLGVQVVEAADRGRYVAADRGRYVAADGALISDEAELDLHALAAVALDKGAVPVLPYTKTHLALCAPALATGISDAMVPFGDIWLSDLEFLGREPSRASEAFSASGSLPMDIRRAYDTLIDRAIRYAPLESAERIQAASLMKSFGLVKADEMLKAHVDRGQSLQQIVEHGYPRDAAALMLLLVRWGERSRRGLPLVPVVSERAFVERSWPMQLAWTDMGEMHGERLDIDQVLTRELDRSRDKADDMGDKVRSEIMGLIGGMLGIDPEQLEELAKGEGESHIKMSAEDLERRLSTGEGGGVSIRDVMMMQGGFPFFSKN